MQFDDDITMELGEDEKSKPEEKQSNEDDQLLKNAATTGTALMLINSHRALFIVLAVACVLPTVTTLWTQNPLANEAVSLLNSNNVAAGDDCNYLKHSVVSWVTGMAIEHVESFANDHDTTYLLWAELMPVRCSDWQDDGVITTCEVFPDMHTCSVWDEMRPESAEAATRDHFSRYLDVRPGEVLEVVSKFQDPNGTTYYVRAFFNESSTVAYT